MSIDARYLSFSPEQLWRVVQPRIYFNSRVLRFSPNAHDRSGDSLKVLLEVPGEYLAHYNSGFRVSVLDAALDEQVRPQGDLTFSPVEERRFYADVRSFSAILDATQGGLAPGSYIARIWEDKYQLTDSSEHEFEWVHEVIAEHRFVVLDPDEYDEFWLRIFGEDWDEPLYWDSVEANQAAELVQGLPVEGLLERIGDVTWDGETIHQLLGPLITTCMIRGIGDLPFSVTYPRASSDPPPLPHVDLTKLMWVLRVLGPVWADEAFFYPSFELEYEAYDNSIRIDFSYFSYYYDTREGPSKIPRMYELVRRSLREQVSFRMEPRRRESEYETRRYGGWLIYSEATG